jgi:pimeloyl-ACP methyl ester carboxylesterase
MLAVAVTIAACARGAEAQQDRAASTPVARTVRVAPDVSLEVLDWGGRGPALVFLAGLGNTAHVFDEFAPRFADNFHVVGITRRGFGASAGSPPPRELDTLVADITTILDSANISSAILVGHSIAGEEMTRFAEVHQQRCRGLIYIDAAYDRSGIDTLALQQPSPPGPRIHAADTASLAGVRAFHERVMGVREPESEIRATSRFDATGRYRGEVTADSLKARIVSGSRVARYDRAHCAALGIFAMADSLGDVIPYYSELDVAGRAKGDSLLKFVQAVVADGRSRFASFPQNTVVEIRGGNHFLFLQRPVEVARVMRDFLSGLPKHH